MRLSRGTSMMKDPGTPHTKRYAVTRDGPRPTTLQGTGGLKKEDTNAIFRRGSSRIGGSIKGLLRMGFGIPGFSPLVVFTKQKTGTPVVLSHPTRWKLVDSEQHKRGKKPEKKPRGLFDSLYKRRAEEDPCERRIERSPTFWTKPPTLKREFMGDARALLAHPEWTARPKENKLHSHHAKVKSARPSRWGGGGPRGGVPATKCTDSRIDRRYFLSRSRATTRCTFICRIRPDQTVNQLGTLNKGTNVVGPSV